MEWESRKRHILNRAVCNLVERIEESSYWILDWILDRHSELHFLRFSFKNVIFFMKNLLLERILSRKHIFKIGVSVMTLLRIINFCYTQITFEIVDFCPKCVYFPPKLCDIFTFYLEDVIWPIFFIILSRIGFWKMNLFVRYKFKILKWSLREKFYFLNYKMPCFFSMG